MDKNKEMTEKLIQSSGALEEVSLRLLYEKGDKIAAKYGYKSLKGLDAVHFFLVQKHHWTPAQVRTMKYEDLAFCVSEEVN